MKHTVIFTKCKLDGDLMYSAICTFTGPVTLEASGDILTEAVTAWINDHYEGTKAYDDIDEYFDVFDLRRCCSGDVLREVGVTDLKVRMIPDYHHVEMTKRLYKGDVEDCTPIEAPL